MSSVNLHRQNWFLGYILAYKHFLLWQLMLLTHEKCISCHVINNLYGHGQVNETVSFKILPFFLLSHRLDQRNFCPMNQFEVLSCYAVKPQNHDLLGCPQKQHKPINQALYLT